MDQEEKIQLLSGLVSKAERLEYELRELAAELAARADDFTPGGGTATPGGYACLIALQTQLQNSAYGIMLRAELVEQSARVFLSLRTLRYKPLAAPAAPDTKDAQI